MKEFQGKLAKADKKSKVTQKITLYKCGELKSNSECTIYQTLRRMSYTAEEHIWFQSCQPKNKYLRPQMAQSE